MEKSNENNICGKLRASRALNAVLSGLLVLSVCVAPVAAASSRFDVNGDGKVDTKDLIRIMRYISGSIDEDGNPITPPDDSGDGDDSGDKPSITPAYNTVSVNGVPVYSYDGYMSLYNENGSGGRDEETTKLLKNDSNKGKVYRVTISKRLIDSSVDDTVKDPIEPTIFDDNDYCYFSWKDKNQNSIGQQYGQKDSDGVIHYSGGILKYLRDYSIGDIVPVSMRGEVSYISNTTSMDKYNGTYDEHSGSVYFDAIIEFEITK